MSLKVHKDFVPKNAADFQLALKNRLWRLNNLYKIKNKQGKMVTFKLNWAQLDLYRNMHTRNLILKARQLGMSTFLLIFQLDAVYFHGNTLGAVIAHNRNDAEELFSEKVIYAYNNLSQVVADLRKQTSDSKSKIAFDNDSALRVGTSARSGTPQMLHVSEMGKIAAKYPHKAKEIKTGSFNAVPDDGLIWVESTAEGRDGYFYDLVMNARAMQEANQKLTPLDFKLHFYPWWEHDEYALNPYGVTLSSEFIDYFQYLSDSHNIQLSDAQKAWYFKKSEGVISDDVKREYPATIDEAFEASIVGSYFGSQMSKMRRDGRITHLPVDEYLPVHTAWDIGVGDSTFIILYQLSGKWIQIVDCYEQTGEGLPHYAGHLRDWCKEHNQAIVKHNAPHDIKAREWSHGKPRYEVARDLGINFETYTRPADLHEDTIELGRATLARVIINESTCGPLIKCLDSYQKEWDDKLGCFRNKPLHNWASHGAAAFLILCKATTDATGFDTSVLTEQSVTELYNMYGPPVLG